MDNGDDTRVAVPPWRAVPCNRRPHPPSMEPIPIDDSPDPVEDTQNSISCQVCKGNSGCEMASALWGGQQMCTLCFNMNFAMLMIKEGDLEGRYCFALDAALRSLVKKSGGEEILEIFRAVDEVKAKRMADDSDIAG